MDRGSRGSKRHKSNEHDVKSESKRSVKRRIESSTAEHTALPTKSVLDPEERSFPRGGASILTPIERKQVQIEADRDALFEESGKKRSLPKDISDDEEEDSPDKENERKPKKKRKTRASGKDHESIKAAHVERIESLSFQKLVPGSIVLGQVAQISSRDIAIALPNNLTGYVPLTSISGQLNQRMEKLLADTEENDDDDASSNEFQDVDIKKLFHIGQFLRTSVVSNDNARGSRQRKHIELSLEPERTNAGLTINDLVVNTTVQASVVSVEDGGLVMDLGLGGEKARGFIGASEVGKDIKHSEVEEGAVLLCLVTGHSGNGRVIKLSSDPLRLGNVKKGNVLTNAPSINAFLPGTAVKVLISDTSAAGIKGTIMGMLDVTADLIHAGGAQGGQEIEDRYKAGSTVQARVLFSFPKNEVNKIGVSLVEHIVSLSSKCLSNKEHVLPEIQLPTSSIVEEAKVIKVDSKNGLYLDVGIPRVYGFAHISRISDSKIDTVSAEIGSYKVGSVHRARILGFSVVDGLFSISLEKSVLEQPFLRLEDVTPGVLVDGTIEDMPIKGNGVSGILLLLAEGIRGFVPAVHMADVQLKHPERKYRVGMKVKARVLSTNIEKRTIYLTMKKSLISTEIAWNDFAKLEIDAKSPGAITKINESGAWIQFYGDVRGFLPVAEMSEAYIKDPSEHFHVGQVVNTRIISVDKETQRMLLSCKDKPSEASLSRDEAFNELQVGQLVAASIIELADDLISLQLEGGIQGHLQVAHLTDGSSKKNSSALNNMRAGMTLQDLVILQKLKGPRAVKLSKKPSLIKATRAGVLPTSFNQLKRGETVSGFVARITTSGAFVEFANRLTGLLPVAGMTDVMKDKKPQDYGLEVGQSITARVWGIYATEDRFTLTLRDEEPATPAEPKQENPKLFRPPRELRDPVDDKLVTIDELTIGKQTLARVNAIKELQLNVSLADGVDGRIHITEVFKAFADIEDASKPLQSIKHNSILPVTVIGLHDTKTHKFLAITNRQSVHPVFECSHRQAHTSEPENLSLLKLKEGEEHLGFIYKYTSSYALVSLSPEVHGTVDISALASVSTDYQSSFPIGAAIRVIVKMIDVQKSKVHLVPAGADSWQHRAIEVGNTYVGRVCRSHADGVDVELAKNTWGMIPLTELADDYDQARPELWASRDAIKVKVLGRSKEGLVLSARPSLTSNEPTEIAVKDRHFNDDSEVQLCEVVRGYVKKISKQGMLVRLGWNVTAQVPVHDLSDEYIKDFTSAFKLRQLVTGKIIKTDPVDGHHKMSLRLSAVNDPDYKPLINFIDMVEGQIVDAVVVKVESYGVFILVTNSKNVRGLCHVKELADTRIEDPSQLYSEGDKVKAKVIKLDKAKKRVNFSLKAVHFQQVNQEESDEDMNDAEQDEEVAEIVDDGDLSGEEQSEESEVEDEVQDMSEYDYSKPSAAKDALQTNGFDWTGTTTATSGDISLSEPEQHPDKKKRRKGEIQMDVTGELDKLGPQSVGDFERLLLGQPNSSALWIQYMAFQLGLNEVEKAREVAERALKTIHMREEEEKANMWTALLNLENTYGTEESLESVFERACEYSDRKEVSQRLASIYIDSGKHKEAEQLFERMRKIRGLSSDHGYWLNYASFLMSTAGRPDDARALLQRATQSVPSHQHAHLISRFGALEFQSPRGDKERGRTIFEGLVDAHKNSHDLWDQYLAQEMGAHGDVDKARALFERSVKMKMRPKRAKSLFKKWLSWESKLADEGKGSDKHVTRVKFLAEEYIAKNGSKSDQ